MPGSYRIDPALRLVHYRYEGVITRDDMIVVARQAITDPLFEVGYRVLIDLTAMTQNAVEAEGVRALAEGVSQTLDQRGPRWQVAVAAPSDVAFGFARMYEMLRSQSPEDVHVFRTLDEACAFLGLDRATLA